MSLPVALAQFRPVKPDPEASLDRLTREVLEPLAEADPPPRVLLLPETALTGYFLEGGVREHALGAGELFEALRDRWSAASGGRPLEVAVGFYERHRDRVHNAAMYAELGGDDPGVLHVHRKVFLPTYGVFQEDRFVEPGAGFAAFDTAWGRAALLVCEDAWHSISATLAALDGAQAIFVLSASPAHGTEPGPGVPGNVERWDRLVRGISEEHTVWTATCQLTGFEGGKGFPGGSMAVDPRGRVVARSPLWEEALLRVELDDELLMDARTRSPLLADLEAAFPRILAASPATRRPVPDAPARGDGGGATPGPDDAGGGDASAEAGAREAEADVSAETSREGAGAPDAAGGGGTEGGGATADARPGAAAAPGSGPLPPLGRSMPPETGPEPDPGDRSPLEIDTELVEEWLVQFLHQEVRERRGFERAVVGLSGGVDSSLAALLAARALGGGSVQGLLLPSRLTSDRSAEDAREVAEIGGLETRTIPIDEAVDGYVEAHEPDASELRVGNVMARVRMTVLFDQAKKLGALPVGTGNKSERLLGYFTWHADDAPPVNPLGDLFKTQVWALARHVGVPEGIVEKPATAELVAGQTDEEDLGVSYPEADLVLHHLLTGRSPGELIARGFDERKVEAVVERLSASHYKRHLPTVAMLSSTAVNEWYLRPVDY